MERRQARRSRKIVKMPEKINIYENVDKLDKDPVIGIIKMTALYLNREGL
ncbi:MAG: hypothetical protein ABFC85_03040 [Rectinema sp.]|jgi:hypothetical protein